MFANKAVSPKVFWSGVLGVLLAVVLGGLQALSPETLEVFGPYAPVVAVLVTTLIAYLKSDPLRLRGARAVEEDIVNAAAPPQFEPEELVDTAPETKDVPPGAVPSA